MRKSIKKILAIGGAIALVGATLTGCSTGITQDNLDTAVAEAKDAAYGDGVIAGVESVDITSDNAAVVSAVTAEDEAEIDRLNQVIADAEAVQVIVDAETAAEGYVLDDLEIGTEFNHTLSDREVDKLFDNELDFDGDDYEAEEIVYLKGTVRANVEEDYHEDTYMHVKENAFTYNLVIENSLNTSLITADDSLEFNFLGEDVEVIDWSVYEVTFTKGVRLNPVQGETIEVEGKNFTVKTISSDDNGPWVYIMGETESDKIYEGKTEEIDGVEFKAVAVLDNEVGEINPDEVILEVGKEVLIQVEDEEEYAKDSIWSYSITANSIGIVLNEDHIDINDDFNALAMEEELCMPNDYICVTYDGLVEEDVESYEFDIDFKGDVEYVRAKGDFRLGINDYDKLYINNTGIYEYDREMLIVGTTVELDDTDLMLVLDNGTLTIDDIQFNLALNTASVAGVDITNEDEDYRTVYGAVVINPEDNLEDNELRIDIPEEKLEAEVTIR